MALCTPQNLRSDHLSGGHLQEAMESLGHVVWDVHMHAQKALKRGVELRGGREERCRPEAGTYTSPGLQLQYRKLRILRILNSNLVFQSI